MDPPKVGNSLCEYIVFVSRKPLLKTYVYIYFQLKANFTATTDSLTTFWKRDLIENTAKKNIMTWYYKLDNTRMILKM